MSELKTLKDLKCIRDEEYSCCDRDKSQCNEPWTDDNDLRKEAIKYIKELEDKRNIDITGVIVIWYGSDAQFLEEEEKDVIVEFMEHFFNITKEDLK